MPKAIKKRRSKKIDVPEEEVQERLSTLKDALQQRQGVMLKIGVGIAVLIAVVVSLLIYSHTAASKAKKLEYEAYTIYYGKASQQAGAREDRYGKALNIFKQAYQARKSPFSLYYIAACSYELGNYDEALKTLKDFTRKYSGEAEFLPLAYRKMSTIYLQKDNTAEAKKMLDALYNLKGDIYKDFALMEYGKLLEREGKLDEAKSKYEELITRFPTSPFKDEAQLKVAEKKEG